MPCSVLSYYMCIEKHRAYSVRVSKWLFAAFWLLLQCFNGNGHIHTQLNLHQAQ
jgi:hypothetical protein